MSDPVDYAVTIQPIREGMGSGFMALVPDLPGCMSDGETPEEALINVRDAIVCWIEAANDMGHKVPDPSPPPPESMMKYA